MAKKRPKESVDGTIASLERIEQQELLRLARSGKSKLEKGEKPTREESRAIKKVHQEALEKYGNERIANFPKGELAKAIGKQSKVIIDQAKIADLPWGDNPRTINLVAYIGAFHDFLTKHAKELPKFLRRAERVTRLAETGDGDEGDLNYDQWDARRVRAIALIKEQELAREMSGWVPIEVMEQIARVTYEGEIRSMIDDYDKREKVTGSEVTARLRLLLGRIEQQLGDIISKDGSSDEDIA